MFLAFAGALALSWARPLLLFREEETEGFQLDEAFLVAMALLLSPFEVVLAFGVGVAVGYSVRRRGMLRFAFNLGQSVAAAGIATFAMRAVSPLAGPVDAADLLAVLAGAAVFFAIQSVSVSGVIALAEGRRFGSAFLDGIGVRLVVWAGNVSVGLLAGIIGIIYPWALAFAAVPLGVLHVVFAGHLRARRDRERMNGLFETAVAAHASMGIGDVERALAESARTLLRCGRARFDDGPPREGELGTRVGSAGSERWLIVSERRGVEPFDDADQSLLEAIVAIGAAALDNASLYQQASEERQKLADVVGSSSDGIFSVDADGRIASWNAAMERVTGFSAEEMVGTRHLGTLRPRDAEGRDVMTEGWVESDSIPPPDLQITTNRGEARWLSCAVSPLPERGLVVVARDVTAQREIEELKADFLATISHELRTPLTPIQGFLQTLVREGVRFTDEEREGFYRIMLAQSERLGRLVADLLDAVSLQGAELAMLPEEVDWADSAAGPVELARRQHPDREFGLEIDDDLPTAVADRRRAEQILSNLLTNAVKYSPAGSPVRVTIGARGPMILTTVADRGPGIPPADRERVFERFTRLGDHMTRAIGGVGLGLFIARRLVESMGGRIWVEDAPEGGAAFSFTVPAYQGSHLRLRPETD